MALILNLGVAAVYAHEKPVKMAFSGTAANTAINLQRPDTSNDEDNFAGSGTLGSFTIRNVRAIANSPTSSSACPGSNQLFFAETALRRRISLQGWQSVVSPSHRRRRLHRSRNE